MNCKNCCNMGCKFRFSDDNQKHVLAYYRPENGTIALRFDKVWKVECKKYQPDEAE